MSAAIPHVLPNRPGTAITAIFKGRKLAIPIPAVFSATAFVMVLVVGVFEFIVRIMMIFAVRQTLSMLLGMNS